MTGENTGDNPRRVLLKLSGEAFGGGKVGIDTTVVRRIAEEIVPAVKQGAQVAIDTVDDVEYQSLCPQCWYREYRAFLARHPKK